MQKARLHILLAGAWLMVGCVAALSAPKGPAMAGHEPAAVPLSVEDLRVDLASNQVGAARTVLLSGAELNVHVHGVSADKCAWEFGYEGTVLARGRAAVDKEGVGHMRLVLPDVLHRTVCQLLMVAGETSVQKTVVTYPTSFLSESAQRLRDIRIGVIDASGRVQRALGAEGVACADLRSQIEQDYFDGGMVILAGAADAAALSQTGARFDSRLRGGTAVLVLNPPVGWSGWGMARVRLKTPLRASPQLAAALSRTVPVEDVGEGPWTVALTSDADAVALAHVIRSRPYASDAQPQASVARPRASNVEPPDQHLLAAACQVGRGRIVVSGFPQTECPDTNAVGRRLTGEMILWLADQPPAAQPGPKEGRHE